MKRLFTILLAFCAVLAMPAADAPIDISLQDGSRIKGRVMSVTASEATVMTDLGVFRIPLEKLTPESKAAVTQGSTPDVTSLLQRIAELEAKVTQLQQENSALRQQAASAPPSSYPAASGTSRFTPRSSGATAPSGLSYTISSTGKRHNSNCRYYSSGRSCGPTDGIACKICGG